MSRRDGTQLGRPGGRRPFRLALAGSLTGLFLLLAALMAPLIAAAGLPSPAASAVPGGPVATPDLRTGLAPWLVLTATQSDLPMVLHRPATFR